MYSYMSRVSVTPWDDWVYRIREYILYTSILRMCMHRHAHVQYIVRSIYAYSAVLCDKVCICIMYCYMFWNVSSMLSSLIILIEWHLYIIYMYFINVLYFMLYI